MKIYTDYSSRCEKGDISITEESSCEHCGALEPYEPSYSDGGTWWCDICFESNGNVIPDDIKEKIDIKRKELQRKYYKNKLKELDEPRT